MSTAFTRNDSLATTAEANHSSTSPAARSSEMYNVSSGVSSMTACAGASNPITPKGSTHILPLFTTPQHHHQQQQQGGPNGNGYQRGPNANGYGHQQPHQAGANANEEGGAGEDEDASLPPVERTWTHDGFEEMVI